MRRSQLSLATVVIGIIVIIVSAALAVVGTIAYRSYSAQKWSEFHEAVNLEAERLSIALTPAIWNLEYPQIQKVMESLMKDPRYAGIVVDVGNRQLTLGRNPDGMGFSATTPPPIAGALVRHRPVVHADQPIGILTLYATSAQLEADLKQALFLFIVLALLLDLLITVALYLSLQHLVLKPLRQVERYAGEVALGRIAAPEYSQLELLGELNRLTASIDTLLRQLGQRNIELTKSSEHFKTVIRLLPIPLILYDDDETNLYVNERFVATFGYTLSDIPDSASWYKLAYPDPAYRKEVIAMWRQEKADAQVAHRAIRARPYRVQCRDGSTKYVEIGGIVSAGVSLAVLDDVTDRTLADTELRRYREHLEEVVSTRTAELVASSRRLEETQFAMAHAGIGIVWINPEDGRFLYVNDHACVLFGRPRESLLQSCVADVTDAFTREHAEALARELQMHGHARLETRIEHAGGTHLPIEVSLYFQPPTPEAVAGRYCAFITDITQRKAAEATLIEAKLAAEGAARTRSEFLANMSHEIRTPMNAIIGMSGLALNGPLEPRERNFIEKVNRAAVSLLGILNDILDFSKIEAGQISIERIDFALDPIFENLAAIFAHEAERKGLALIFDLSPALPDQLTGDPMRLSQILINLLGNAIKFTDAGSVTLACHPLEAPEAGVARLSIAVRDTGIGMSTSQVDGLFSPFQQGDSSISRRYGGTGLGLAICKQLADAMDGRIDVSSTPGGGSTFTLTLPFPLPAPAPGAAPALPAALAHQPALVVHPHAEVRASLCRMVTALGMPGEGVETAAEALARLARGDVPRLVLSAASLPDKAGIDLFREVSGRLGHDAPRLVLIAKPSELAASERHAREVPAVSMVSAPLRPASLLAALSGPAGIDALPRPPDDLPEPLLAGLDILVVDDNDLNQELAREILQSYGARVSVAENGQIALERLAGQRFDCVLMDVQMPVMDGLTATRVIRGNPRWKAMPVIAMTAGVTPGERELARQAGMAGHVAKPIEVEALIGTILRLVTPRDATPAQRPAASGADAAVVYLDTAAALGMLKDDRPLYKRLLTMLITQMDEKMGRLEDLCRAGSHAEVARLAHSMKGACASTGAGPLADALRGIETACETAADGAVLLERAASAKALWCETEQACRHYLGLNGDLADRGDVGAP
jgi:PAS domain S-box-containing protein